MDRADYLETLDDETAKFIEAVGSVSFDTPVAALGDWTVRDLARHQGSVWSFATANTAALSTERSLHPNGRPPEDDDDLVPWLKSLRAEMLSTMTDADPAASAWTFADDDQTTRFWLRRMAHETIIHRWDAQSAALDIDPFYPQVAADGIDEYTSVGLRYSSSRPDRVYPSRSLHLHCTDTEGEWTMVADGAGGVDVTREHAKGDAAVRGTAQSLLLWIWNRPTDGYEIFGDESVAAAWQALAP